jgi:hypothetical protein
MCIVEAYTEFLNDFVLSIGISESCVLGVSAQVLHRGSSGSMQTLLHCVRIHVSFVVRSQLGMCIQCLDMFAHSVGRPEVS